MTDSQDRALATPQPDHILEWAIFIEEYREGKLTVEVAVLTDGEVWGHAAETVRKWALKEASKNITELGEVLAAFSRADKLAIWVNVGLYDHATNNSPNGR